MVNESILGGLRTAISHKYSLKEAMQSFYNAGYSKADIEEAGKIIFKEQQNALTNQGEIISTPNKKNIQTKPLPTQPQVIEKKSSSKKIGMIILLSGILLILLGAIIFLIMFRDKIF